MRLVIIAAVALWPVMAKAQTWDCSAPDTLPQQGMNYCAKLDWEASDRDLNTAYKAARAAMQRLDSYQPEGQKGAANALRDAQRAWIPFRDKACAAEGWLFRGGTMEPLIVFSCLTKLTQSRTQSLEFLAAQ